MSQPLPAASAADESLGHAVVLDPANAIVGHKANTDSISVTMTDEEVVAQSNRAFVTCCLFLFFVLCFHAVVTLDFF